MVDQKQKADCCGCRACEQACPKSAITMLPDAKTGFIYPKIDYSICVTCGVCDKVCGFTENYTKGSEKPEIYAVKHKNDAVRSQSTSGGLFTALSDAILAKGGVIYGAAYDEALSVRHQRACTAEERNLFRGSKYVQSDIQNTYQLARQDLEDGLSVLFSGTPCQISGLIQFLGKPYENLYTIDLLCHGVPSPKLWQEFLSVMRKRAGSTVVAANFRDKSISWTTPKSILKYANGKSGLWGENGFFQLFNPNLMLRDSCYHCKFRSFARPSDITIADFWGIENTMPELQDDKGISLCFVNTPKGQALFAQAATDFDFYKSEPSACRQDQITGAIPKNKRYNEFWDDYRRKGMKYVLVKYTEFSFMRTFIKKCLRRLKRYLNLK